jgi:hypothetical protein
LTWWGRAAIYRSKTKRETYERRDLKKSSAGFIGIGYRKLLESENGVLYLKIGQEESRWKSAKQRKNVPSCTPWRRWLKRHVGHALIHLAHASTRRRWWCESTARLWRRRTLTLTWWRRLKAHSWTWATRWRDKAASRWRRSLKLVRRGRWIAAHGRWCIL